MPINSFLYPAPSTPTFPYQVANSCRFNDGSSDNLSRTTGTPSNRKKFTLSFWCKISGASGNLDPFGIHTDGNTALWLEVPNNGTKRLKFVDYRSGSENAKLETNRLFRDVSGWMSIILICDSTLSTSSDRLKLYINGVRETSFANSIYPSQNYDFTNNIGTTTVGKNYDANYFDGYLAEFVYCDGQALAHTDLGEFDSDSPNIWKPIDVSGLTFGNEGFYLDFENASNLGADVSGNSNNFTVNNLTSVDQSTDTCTNNFATWNPLHPGVTRFNNCVFADGNLEFESNETGYVVYPIAKSTIGVSSGKWYAEFKVLEENAILGISDGISNENYIGGSTSNGVAYQKDGQKRVGNSQSSYGNSYTADDIIGVAMDLDNNRLFFSKNGTFQDSGDPTSSTGAITIPSSSTGVFHFATLDTVSSGTSKVTANFGSPAFSISSGNSDANGHGNFEYSVPSGYFALCTKNLAEFG